MGRPRRPASGIVIRKGARGLLMMRQWVNRATPGAKRLEPGPKGDARLRAGDNGPSGEPNT
jgi:hypothetical protein